MDGFGRTITGQFSVGESAGVPLSATPSPDGTGFGNSVTLRTTDEFDTQKEVT